MRVSNKSWQYTIKELEDYKTWECHIETSCSPAGNNVEICTDYEVCDWKHHTRTHNTWITGGVYPIEPFWEENYTIRTELGYYQKRSESYTVIFVREGDTGATQYPNSLMAYNSYLIGDKHHVTMNVWGGVLKTEKADG